MSSPRTRAFTLIELLVVISIIVLLISMLLPALSSARKAAVNLQCMNQQRQIHVAQSVYAEDNGGWFPPRIGAAHPAIAPIESYDGMWPNNFLLPYVSDLPFSQSPYPDQPAPTLFACPTYRDAFISASSHRYVRYSSKFNYTAVTYTLNRGMFLGPSHHTPVVKPEYVRRPSAKSYLIDGLLDNTRIHHAATWAHFAPTTILNMHVGGSNNVLYFDGHVTNMQGNTLLNDASNLFYLQDVGGSS